MVLNKTDLLDSVDFRMDFFTAGVRAVNPHAEIFHVSCRKDHGVEEVVNWLVKGGKK